MNMAIAHQRQIRDAMAAAHPRDQLAAEFGPWS
jgi:hypothetical protein